MRAIKHVNSWCYVGASTTHMFVSQQFPLEGMVWCERAVALNFSVGVELRRLPPFPLRSPRSNRCGCDVSLSYWLQWLSRTDALLDGRDRWPWKLKCPPAAYIRGW
jgi:hypothetical protein